MTPESEIGTVRRQVIDAVKVMFDRSVARYPNAVEVADKKEDVENTTLSASGPLQDCEFGMVLLLAREWMGDEFLESVGTSDEKFDWVIATLVESTISRLLKPDLKNEGGGGKHTTFFTGEPYTQHSRGRRYSANLDAAMIVLAFLTLAVKRLDATLTQLNPPQLKDVPLPAWITNQRDSVLFIIIDGLKYATECRVVVDGKFLGFTCDPDSNRDRPLDGGLEDENDRLFFSWTACETINDLIGWRKDYFSQRLASLPAAAVEIDELIGDLEKTLDSAAQWCSEVFLDQFKALSLDDPSELVEAIRPLGKDGVPSVAQQESIDHLKTQILNVYHLSQYAAIRSLVPKSVSIDEVRIISDKLDLLVKQSIIGSGLDEAANPKLFNTLTREYKLGKSNPDPYVDDAWYPLVMRSLSGLLSRTLDDFSKRISSGSSEQEVLELTASFRRSLQEHFRNLTKRRPAGGAGGPDGKLWSFVSGQPYVMYATQRTIFALMKYADFLKAVDKFQARPRESLDTTEGDLPTQLARKLAKIYLQPIISEMLSDIRKSEDGGLLLQSDNGGGITLPEEPWAKDVVRNWLVSFTDDFQNAQIAADLSQRTSELIRIKKYVESYKPSPNLPARKKENAESQFKVLKEEYESICKCDQVGPKLAQLAKWEEGVLKGILFEYLFRNYIERPVSSFEALLDKEFLPELWRLIQEAKGTQENISKADPTATVI